MTRFACIPERAAWAPIGLRAYRTLIIIATVGMAGGPKKPTTTENVTHTQIAERLDIDRWGVQREIDALVDAGLLRVESRRSGNRYTILFDDVPSQETAPAAAHAVSGDGIVPSQETAPAAALAVSGDGTLTETGAERGELASLATRARTRDPPAFETFWEAWPHQVAKPKAERQYRLAIKRGAIPADILAGVERYVAAKPPDQQWCNPATFLRDDRWLDKPAPAPAQRPLYVNRGGNNGERRQHHSPGRAGSAHTAFTAGVDLVDAAIRSEDGNPGRRQQPDSAPEWPMVSAAGDG